MKWPGGSFLMFLNDVLSGGKYLMLRYWWTALKSGWIFTLLLWRIAFISEAKMNAPSTLV